METGQEKILENGVVTFLLKDGRICLPMKKTGIGKDRRNGHGGGIEEGETILQAAVRELFDESRASHIQGSGARAKPEHLKKVAEIKFDNTTEPGKKFTCKVHFYFLEKWQGTICESDEMGIPEWFLFEKLPLRELMPGDKTFLPLILSGKKIRGSCSYGPRQETITSPFDFEEITEFET